MKKIISTISIIIMFLSLSAQSYNKQVKNNNQFAFDLYKYLESEEDNLFISPFSVSVALAMTYEGAKNKTKKEMAAVMHFPDEKTQLHKDFAGIMQKVSASRNKDSYTFVTANSLWAQNDFKFFHTFFKTIESNYKAPVELVDYKNAENREKARLNINSWTEKKTNKKIKNLLQESDLDKDTKLVLVNAVYFLAEWKIKFEEKNNYEDKFYGVGKETKTMFMRKKYRTKYFEDDKTQVIEIPYIDEKASMVVFLPKKKKGLKALQDNFTNKYYEEIVSKLKYEKTEITFPKFKIESRYDLVKVLSDAGIKQAFTNKADFTDMICKKEIKIDKIIHQTFINVNESGTEAAAATAVVMKRITSTSPENTKKFKADHPFIYIIKDNKTASILFIGQMTNAKNNRDN